LTAYWHGIESGWVGEVTLMVPGVQYRPSRKNTVIPTGVRTSKDLQSLMRAILIAPQSVGNPSRRGKGGYAAYMEWVAAKHPHIYVRLLIQFLPLLIAEHEKVEVGKPRETLMERTYRYAKRFEEVLAKAEGISPNGPSNLPCSASSAGLAREVPLMVPEVQNSPNRKNSVTPAGGRTPEDLQSLIRAILMAPQSVGNPSKRGKGGYAGYMEWVAAKHPRIYESLLIQFLPLLIAEHEKAVEVGKGREMFMEAIERVSKNLKRIGIDPTGSGNLQCSGTKQVS
jgi:hypothetical protein